MIENQGNFFQRLAKGGDAAWKGLESFFKTNKGDIFEAMNTVKAELEKPDKIELEKPDNDQIKKDKLAK
ncbi:MAG: hypothetical protein FWC91_12745 [Defluviitaleaceae bacterium]|nr:hypothetical protein [Defluviitaleaceae bacterium]